ncbi:MULTISPECIES: RluA family pseudouridine synthase [Sporosarcina]|uniref:Pseudouridine synthase n=1 Tax=Sporosarcina newyorkensis 2681 TaxID=1027292 RepID=F9DPU5_9BACL|nr:MULTISPECIES: RluA family pseudouridine synthase [Sporosarcina]EGQ27138.1 ribosomal large subunit pseudouridine synthase D [Sporosarcina newyorkensis 2681]MBY0221681.1 RluA family pseudouridine synthase [Sporosarcina aquimarina]
MSRRYFLLKRKPEAFSKTEYTVQEQIELLPFLLKVLSKTSRNSVKSILTRGQVMVDGQMMRQHNYSLQIGQKVEIQSNQVALNISKLVGVTILHEDEDIIVINKEAGILSVASKREREMTAYRQVTDYVRSSDVRNRIFVVHRLDKDTSGVMMFAKNEKTQQTLQNTWSESVKERMYTALVQGKVKSESGTITSWLTENSAFKVYSSPIDNGGQHAITHYKRIQSNKKCSLLEVLLETGRKNQIRVHMEELGHPVLGDKKYGSTSNPLRRLGLHATALSFLHPRTGELVRFEAEVPAMFITRSK